MDSVFQLFRMLFGILVALIIFLIIYNYGTEYMEVGELNNLVKSYNNLKQNINDVALTGNSMYFRDTSSFTNGDCTLNFEITSGLYIKCDQGGSYTLPQLSIISFEDNIFLERRLINTTFINYYYVTGFPARTYIISSDMSSQNILPYIKIMPSNANYYLCGNNICNLKGTGCTKEKIVEELEYGYPEIDSECNIDANKKYASIIKFTSGTCSGNFDLCLNQINNDIYPSYAIINYKKEYEFYIKNNIDFSGILSLLNNKEKINEYINIYNYYAIWNQKLFQDLTNIISMLEIRSDLISKDSKQECSNLWSEYKHSLMDLKQFSEKSLYSKNYNSLEFARNYIYTIRNVNTKYQNLTSNGCDYEYEYQTEF